MTFDPFDLSKDLTPAPKPPTDPRPARALVIARGGLWHVLDHQGEAIRQALNDGPLHDSIEGDPDQDGILVWEGDWSPNGPSDWPGGGLEYILRGTWRQATDEEWRSFIEGLFVWEEWHGESAEEWGSR